MSIVSNGFVISVRWLTNLREVRIAHLLGLDQQIAALLPLFCLFFAAFLILQVRRLFGMIGGTARQIAFMRPIAQIMSSISVKDLVLLSL